MESPILYTTWVIAGSKPINIIIGTNTGAKIAHFADADPMNIFTYIPVILGFAHKYDKNVGLGTIIANMLPFSVTFAIVWIIQVIIWVALNLPLGPGGGIYL